MLKTLPSPYTNPNPATPKTPPSPQSDRSTESFRNMTTQTTDPIACITACDSVLMIGRASGVVNRYSLPHLTLDAQHVLRCRPQVRTDEGVGSQPRVELRRGRSHGQ